MSYCYFCSYELPYGEKIYRTTNCPECGNPLKVCLNCRFYDKSAQHQCRETISEPVRVKDRANFCDFFSPARNPSGNIPGKGKSEAVNRFNSLFSD